MINLQCAVILTNIITFLMVYLFSAAITGAFRAWVAEKMGDSTAVDAGFLTLNPLVHIDIMGLIFLMLLKFGWSRMVPINPYNIDGSFALVGARTGWRIPKLILAYFSNAIAYFFIALVALVVLVALFGQKFLVFAHTMLFREHCLSHLIIAHAFPHLSSLTVAIGFVLVSLVYLCIIIGVLDGIINCCQLAMVLIVDHTTVDIAENSLMLFIVPMVLILFFGASLRYIVSALMFYSGLIISQLLGLA